MSLKSLIAAIFGLKTEDEYNHLKDTNTKLMTEIPITFILLSSFILHQHYQYSNNF